MPWAAARLDAQPAGRHEPWMGRAPRASGALRDSPTVPPAAGCGPGRQSPITVVVPIRIIPVGASPLGDRARVRGGRMRVRSAIAHHRGSPSGPALPVSVRLEAARRPRRRRGAGQIGNRPSPGSSPSGSPRPGSAWSGSARSRPSPAGPARLGPGPLGPGLSGVSCPRLRLGLSWGNLVVRVTVRPSAVRLTVTVPVGRSKASCQPSWCTALW